MPLLVAALMAFTRQFVALFFPTHSLIPLPMVYFNIAHTTSYTYDQYVTGSKNIIRMFPMQTEYQNVVSQSLTISGCPRVIVSKDSFGNKIGMFTIEQPHNRLIIESCVEIHNQEYDAYGMASRTSHNWEDTQLFIRDTAFQLFLNNREFAVIQDIKRVVDSFQPQNMTPFQVAMAFSEYVYKNFIYKPGCTNVNSSLTEVWNLKAGVCQDFAHVLIYMLRLVNLPSRYVSGYICPNNNGMRGDGASHAWMEVYLPNYGWLGIDPTNNCCADEKYVYVAAGRDYHDVAPMKGEFRGSANQYLNVLVTVSYQKMMEAA